MKYFLHWLKHLFHMNTGEIYTWWDKDTLMIGLKCDECDTITGVFASDERREWP